MCHFWHKSALFVYFWWRQFRRRRPVPAALASDVCASRRAHAVNTFLVIFRPKMIQKCHFWHVSCLVNEKCWVGTSTFRRHFQIGLRALVSENGQKFDVLRLAPQRPFFPTFEVGVLTDFNRRNFLAKIASDFRKGDCYPQFT